MSPTENNSTSEILVVDVGGQSDIVANHPPHYFTHLLCREGTAWFRIENRHLQLEKNAIAIWLPSIGINDFACSANFKAIALFVSYNLMSRNNPDISWGIKGYVFSKENPVVHLSQTDVDKCLSNFNFLDEKYRDKQHRFRTEMVNLQLQIFVLDMWNIFSKEIEKRSVTNQKGALFERFLQLVGEHCMDEREVDFYAGKLCITPKYLTEVCKKSSAKSASEWIQNYTTQRLIILLENKQLGFTEIADILHFSSPSFFSRYVRKVLGVSPSEYRQRLGA